MIITYPTRHCQTTNTSPSPATHAYSNHGLPPTAANCRHTLHPSRAARGETRTQKTFEVFQSIVTRLTQLSFDSRRDIPTTHAVGITSTDRTALCLQKVEYSERHDTSQSCYLDAHHHQSSELLRFLLPNTTTAQNGQSDFVCHNNASAVESRSPGVPSSGLDMCAAAQSRSPAPAGFSTARPPPLVVIRLIRDCIWF